MMEEEHKLRFLSDKSKRSVGFCCDNFDMKFPGKFFVNPHS